MTTTRAWVSHQAGGPATLALEEVQVPRPRGNEVLVRVQAIGINFPDGLLIRDLYQVRPTRPLVPGSEFCGVVEDIGAEATYLQRGDVVVGATGWGAMSEYFAAAEDRLFRIPNTFPPEEAAAFVFTHATAYHALHDAGRIQAGETLLVLGAAGGIGSAAVGLGRAFGAKVIAGASTQQKVDFAMAAGATVGLTYDSDLQTGDGQRAFAATLNELAPGGLDLVLDPVGGPYTEPAMRRLCRGGRHLVVGFAAGIPRVPLNIALLRSCQIIGVDWRTFVERERPANEENLKSLFAMWQREQIHPTVTELFPFEEAPAAIARVEERRAIGKIVVSFHA